MSSPTVTPAFLRDLMQQGAIGQGQLDSDQVGREVNAQAPEVGQMPSDEDVINAAGLKYGPEILNAHNDMQQAKSDLDDARMAYLARGAEAIKASNYDPRVAGIVLGHMGGEREFADHVNQIRLLAYENPEALKPIVDHVIDAAANSGSSQGTDGQADSEAGEAPGGDDQDAAAAENGQGGQERDLFANQSQQAPRQAAQPQQGRQPARPQPLPPPLPSPPRTPIEGIRGIVADIANSKTNSQDYLVAKSKGNFGPGSDKCNLLVADIIEESGLPRPQVPYKNEGVKGKISNTMERMRDPDANEWANPKVKIPEWSEPRPLSEARPGDVIAQQHGNGGHAGMIVWNPDQGKLLTVSVNTADKIPGLVTQNPWGFREPPYNGEKPGDPAPVVRHYIGK
jgi:hypothetical protein